MPPSRESTPSKSAGEVWRQKSSTGSVKTGRSARSHTLSSISIHRPGAHSSNFQRRQRCARCVRSLQHWFCGPFMGHFEDKHADPDDEREEREAVEQGEGKEFETLPCGYRNRSGRQVDYQTDPKPPGVAAPPPSAGAASVSVTTSRSAKGDAGHLIRDVVEDIMIKDKRTGKMAQMSKVSLSRDNPAVNQKDLNTMLQWKEDDVVDSSPRDMKGYKNPRYSKLKKVLTEDIKKLHTLELIDCKLRETPPVLRDVPTLKELRMSHNEVKLLTEEWLWPESRLGELKPWTCSKPEPEEGPEAADDPDLACLADGIPAYRCFDAPEGWDGPEEAIEDGGPEEPEHPDIQTDKGPERFYEPITSALDVFERFPWDSTIWGRSLIDGGDPDWLKVTGKDGEDWYLPISWPTPGFRDDGVDPQKLLYEEESYEKIRRAVEPIKGCNWEKREVFADALTAGDAHALIKANEQSGDDDVLEEVKERPQLEKLFLDWNCIYSIEVSALSGAMCEKLQVLNLSNNEINVLPKDFLEGAHEMKFLDLSGNKKISKLPDTIMNCRKMELLFLTHNSIEVLPDIVVETEVNVIPEAGGKATQRIRTARLQKLRKLFVGYNKLKTLPEDIGRCRRLEKLRVMHNNICLMPRSIIQLENLQEFAFVGNPLQQPLKESASLETNMNIFKEFWDDADEREERERKGRNEPKLAPGRRATPGASSTSLLSSTTNNTGETVTAGDAIMPDSRAGTPFTPSAQERPAEPGPASNVGRFKAPRTTRLRE